MLSPCNTHPGLVACENRAVSLMMVLALNTYICILRHREGHTSVIVAGSVDLMREGAGSRG